MADQVVRLRDRLTSKSAGGHSASLDRLKNRAGKANLRKAPRKSSLLPAHIQVDGRQRMINCEVVDMSATGACVKVDTGDRHIKEAVDGFPNYIKLFITYDRMRVDCQIMWRNTDANMVGVKFTSVPQFY